MVNERNKEQEEAEKEEEKKEQNFNPGLAVIGLSGH